MQLAAIQIKKQKRVFFHLSNLKFPIAKVVNKRLTVEMIEKFILFDI
jgi:hypothetical protein